MKYLQQTSTCLLCLLAVVFSQCHSGRSFQGNSIPKPDKEDNSFEAKLGYEIERLIYYNSDINHKNTPGFIIGVLVNDSFYTYDYGSVMKGGQEPLADTLGFEVGGITKVFTASLVQVLVDKGLLSMQTSIAGLYPFKEPSAHARLTTVADLLSHTAGLPRLPNGFGLQQGSPTNPYANYSKTSLLDTYQNFADSYSTDKVYNYSEYGYGLLEILLEQKFEKAYHELLMTHLLEPLGLEHSRLATSSRPLRLIPGYNRIGNEVASWQFKAFEASSGLQSSMRDLLSFLQYQIDAKPGTLNTSFQKIQDPVASIDSKQDALVAKGWHILQPKNYHQVLSHSGYTSGHRAYMGAVKETNTGVVVLSNSEVEMSSIGLQVLRHLNNYWKAN